MPVGLRDMLVEVVKGRKRRVRKGGRAVKAIRVVRVRRMRVRVRGVSSRVVGEKGDWGRMRGAWRMRARSICMSSSRLWMMSLIALRVRKIVVD